MDIFEEPQQKSVLCADGCQNVYLHFFKDSQIQSCFYMNYLLILKHEKTSRKPLGRLHLSVFFLHPVEYQHARNLRYFIEPFQSLIL
jgi:hypothetical protein